MATVMDPVDLLCRNSASLAAVAPGLGLPQGFQPMYPGSLPWMPPARAAAVAGQLPSTITTSSPLPLPPGLEQQPRADASMRQPPACPAIIAPVHVWALEAKIKAEQAQNKQQQWAEKMQLQYLRGQEVLKVLQERKAEDEQPEEAHRDKANNTAGGAFDRFVSLMGLTNESTCGSEHDASVDQTPQSKKSEKWDPHTPPKQSSRASVSSRKSGEKENKLSPDADTPQSKTRRGRRRGKLSFQ